MKKLAATIAMVSISIFTIQAQTEKGASLIGGHFNFGTSKSTPDYHPRSYYYKLSPKVGHFITNNFAIGTNLSIGYSKTKKYYIPGIEEQRDKQTNLSFGIAPFARYYLAITERFRFFTEFELSWITSKEKGQRVPEGAKEQYVRNQYYGANIKPGLAFFPTKKWAIEMSFPLLGYGKNTRKPVGIPDLKETDDSVFGFGLNTLNPLIGVNYHF